MKTKPRRKRADRDAPTSNDDLPRIPPGEYDAICIATERGRSWGGREDIYLRFRIHGSPCHGTTLFMVCTYHAKAELSRRHKYWQQWTLANGGPPLRGERLSPAVFHNRLFRVIVRYTRKCHSNGRPMPDWIQYSVVDSIVDRLA
jgi:hypothetical protein